MPSTRHLLRFAFLAPLCLAGLKLHAQSFGSEVQIELGLSAMACPPIDGGTLQACNPIDPILASPGNPLNLLRMRARTYASMAAKHKLTGLASYYSTSLDGTLTANGERFHNRQFTAAHLTLPLGSWVEVTARATGRILRLRVNDRGPYAKKFILDLSQAAARALGVDIAEDRHVDIRVIALPGEKPLPENWQPLVAEGAAMAALTPEP